MYAESFVLLFMTFSQMQSYLFGKIRMHILIILYYCAAHSNRLRVTWFFSAKSNLTSFFPSTHFLHL
jgi:phage-related holin